LLIGSSVKRGWVNVGWLQFFGYISYGLYLIHLLVFRLYDRTCQRLVPSLLPRSGRFDLVILRFTIGTALAIFLAYVSRVYFEERFLRLKARWVEGRS